MAWPVTDTRIVYENPWIRVREDAVLRPDGTPGTYGVVSLRHDAVFVVAMTAQDEVMLVEVDRHTVGASIEVPAGGTDGQDLLDAAARELSEETGLVARTWTPLGPMASLNGVCEAYAHVYLATDLTDAGNGNLSEEQRREGIGRVRAVPWAEVLRLVRTGHITDNETIAALMLAAVHLGRVR